MRVRNLFNFAVVFYTLLCISATTVSASPSTSGRGRFFSLVQTLMRQRQPSEPLAKALAHYTMGIIYDTDGNYTAAIGEYQRALLYDAQVSYLHTRLATDYFLTGAAEKAVDELQLAITTDPEDARPHFLLAVIYTQQSNFEAAQAEYEEVVRISPGDLGVLGSFADLLIVQEKVGEAAAVYESLIKTKPSPLLYFNLGVIYTRLGKIDQALAMMREAIARNDTYLEAYSAAGILSTMRGDYPAAIGYTTKALALSPQNPILHFCLGDLYDRTHQRTRAIAAFRAAIALDPEYADAYNYLGYMFADAGENLDEAIELITKALALDPANGAYHDSLGWAYYRKGMLDEAIVELERAVSAGEDDATIYDHLGDVYAAKGLTDKARAAWQDALKLDPQMAAVKKKLQTKNP